MSVLPLEWRWIVWFIAISPVPTAARPIILVCTGQRDFLGHRIFGAKTRKFQPNWDIVPSHLQPCLEHSRCSYNMGYMHESYISKSAFFSLSKHLGCIFFWKSLIWGLPASFQDKCGSVTCRHSDGLGSLNGRAAALGQKAEHRAVLPEATSLKLQKPASLCS